MNKQTTIMRSNHSVLTPGVTSEVEVGKKKICHLASEVNTSSGGKRQVLYLSTGDGENHSGSEACGEEVGVCVTEEVRL